MALNLGTLTGFLDLDSSAFDKSLGGAMDKLKGSGVKGAVIAGAAGAAIGAGLAAGVLGAMNVEKANDKLAAQLGLNAAESERLGSVAGSLYANAYGGSLEEVNTAVGAVVSSIKGMRTATSGEVEALTANALDLASAFEIDVSRAVQVVGQAVTSGLAGDAKQGMDLLTASMQKVPAAVREDLLDAIDEYGPFMAGIGIKGEQAFGLLVTAAEKGMYGIDKTGDALKEFTIRATDMSAASKVGYDALGMSQEEMSGKLLKGGEVGAKAFQQIITGLQNMKDPTEQSTAALALFGTPLEDLSVQEIPKFLKGLTGAQTALGDTAGAADAMGQTLNDNASTNLESFKRQAMQTFVDVVGGKALPAVNEMASRLATGLGPAANVGTAAVTGLGKAIPTPLIHAGTAALTLLVGVLAVQKAATVAASIATGAYTAVKGIFITTTNAETGAVTLSTVARVRHTAAAVAGTVAAGVATVATGAWTAAQWLLNAALTANPLGLVILAIAALAAGLVIAWKNSETFRNVVTGAFSKVLSGVSALLGGIESMLRALGKIPGFGWADTAANKIAGARSSVDGLNASLNRIPPSKLVTVTTRYVVTGDPASSVRGGITQRASGGPVSPYGSYLVGEHGPELLRMGSFGGRITPAGATSAVRGGDGAAAGGGDVYNVTQHVTVDRNSPQELARATTLALVMAT